MRKKLTHNIGLKILSVAVAFLLWLVVVSVDDPITSRPYSSIPVELTNTQAVTREGKVFEVVDNSDVIGISVTAKRSILNTLSRDNFKATADMSKLDPTTNTVPIEVKSNRYADKIDNIVLKTRNVAVNIENLQEEQYTIGIDTKGSPAEGCVVGNISLDKNVIKVSGPESIVSEIDRARASVNVSGMSSDISTEEDVILYDANGNEVDTSELTLSLSTVKIRVEIWKSKEVPVNFSYTGVPAEGFGTTGAATCSLSTVSIAGSKSALNSVDSITIPPTAVDITDARRTVEASVDISRYLPEGVAFASKDFNPVVLITVSVEALQTKMIEIPTSNITVSNVPEGMTAEMGGVGEVVAIEVKGLGDLFTNLNPATIVGIADLDQVERDEGEEELQEGVYELPVVFHLPDGITGGDDIIQVKVALRTAETE